MQASAATTICAGCGDEFVPKVPDQVRCDNCAGLATPDALPNAMEGSVVGGHKLMHTLGGGRFSTSWLAESPDGGGVVLKLLRAYAPDPSTVQRFLDEARRVAKAGTVDHPGVARVLDAGVQLSGALFLVYESGGESTLADELRGRGRLPASRALELCAQICEAAHALHHADVRHLNLKPANVGLAREEDGRETAVLLDGFTAHLLQHAGLRETGMLPISTVAYLSPEESAGREGDPRSDLFAVGVLLYQLISGRLPFIGSTAEELLEAHRSQRALKLRDAGRRVVPELERVIAQLLAKEPGGRFDDGLAAAAALRQQIPVADQVPPASEEEELDDPNPVISGPSLEDELVELGEEPEVASPKAAAPRVEIDPELEQALLGNVPHEHPKVPRTPAAGPSPGTAAGPAWLRDRRLWAAGAAVAALGVIALAWPRSPKRTAAKAPARTSAAPSPAPVAKARPAPPSAPAQPSPVTIVAAPEPAKATAKATARASAKTEARPKANAKTPPKAAPGAPAADDTPPPIAAALGRVQRDLDAGRAAPAAQTLTALLSRSDLNKSAQGRATRLMAEAEAKKGDKKAAVDWYRKYLRLAGDASERARVVKEIQALSR